MTSGRIAAGALGLASALALVACAGGGTSGSSPSASPPASAGAGSSADSGTTSATPTPEPPKDPRPLDERCGQHSGFTPTTWRTPAGSTIAGGTSGSGARTLVLLHAVGTSGLCEGLPVGTVAAARGMTVVVMDACGWGASSCVPRDMADPRAAVQAIVTQVRSGPTKPVIVMGSSMGGAVALAAATLDGVDAVVDVSGPGSWSGVPDAATSAKAAADRKVPTLLVVADQDEASIVVGVASAEHAAPSAPAIHDPGGAHGFALLVPGATVASATASPTGATVLDWIAAVKPRAS